MNRFTTIIFLIALMTSSCSDSIENMEFMEESVTELQFNSISFNLNCGWCLSRKQLLINKDQSVYFLESKPCEEDNIVKADRMLTEDEFNEFLETFNLEDFLSVNFDKCGECYDGCDDTVIFEGLGGENHTIRYDSFDKYEELQGIKPFVETLYKIRDTF